MSASVIQRRGDKVLFNDTLTQNVGERLQCSTTLTMKRAFDQIGNLGAIRSTQQRSCQHDHPFVRLSVFSWFIGHRNLFVCLSVCLSVFVSVRLLVFVFQYHRIALYSD